MLQTNRVVIWGVILTIAALTGCAQKNEQARAQRGKQKYTKQDTNVAWKKYTQQRSGQAEQTYPQGSPQTMRAQLKAAYDQLDAVHGELASAITESTMMKRSMQDHIRRLIEDEQQEEQVRADLKRMERDFKSGRKSAQELTGQMQHQLAALIQLRNRQAIANQIMNATKDRMMETLQTQDKRFANLQKRIQLLQRKIKSLETQVGQVN